MNYFTEYNNHNLSRRTISCYISRLNTIAKLATNNKFINPDILDNPQNILIKLNHSTIKNKKQYITAIINYLSLFTDSEYLIEEYLKISKSIF